jgi:hypothetical protein
MTPRLLMNNPRLKIKAREPKLTREQAEAVRMLFEERQNEVDYALSLIPVARRGLKYGLGVAKNFWETKTRTPLALEQGDMKARILGPYVKRREERIEGPQTEDVEILDFFWDPAAKDIETARWVIHRTWRDTAYVRERIEMQQWLPVDMEKVGSMGPPNDRSSVFSDRSDAGASDYSEKLPDMHEVWEWHDGNNVVTVLDGSLVVQHGESPISGDLPFSIFRPTLQENEFVGIGEIEPIVDLQRELNTMRSARLDNTMLLIQKAFIYAEGLVDPADLVIGPGRGIPVEGGAIDDVIKPIAFGEMPTAGYQEEAGLKADFEMATGLSETVAGSQGSGNASETATGIQYVQAAANVRLELKTKLLAHECVKRDTRQWLALYREKTLLEPQQVIIEDPKGETGFKAIEITGEDLDLVRAVDPEEDSLAPENAPEKKNNALALYNQVRGNPVVEQRPAARFLLDAFDVPNAEEWIIPEQEQMSPQVAQVVGEAFKATLMSAGMEEEQAEQVTLQAMQAAMQTTGVSGGAEDQGAPSQNGAPSAPPPPPSSSSQEEEETPVG